MKRPNRWLSLLLTLVLCLGLFPPMKVSAANLYFTSINDNLLPLTSDSMPVWMGGTLYVPYNVFDGGSTGIDLGIYASYSRSYNTVSLFNTQLNLQQILVYDLNTNTCRNDVTQEGLPGRAIMRNGKPYLPLNTVCSFFGLDYSYTALPTVAQGYLVRIKNAAVVLSDPVFIDAADSLIHRRLREYNQSLNPPAPPPQQPSGGTPPVAPPVPPEEDSTGAPTYLSFICQNGDGLAEILNTLDRSGKSAMFFLSPQAIRENGALLHRILGSGHSIGLLAEGADWEKSRAILAEGQELLAQLAYTRATAAYIPPAQRKEAARQGWVCWSDTLSLSPTSRTGADSLASNTLRRLAGRTRVTYLSMTCSPDTARVLSTLLRQLEGKNFVINIPMETRI